MIDFSPFWKTMKRKKVTQYQLIKKYGISGGTLNALRTNRSVTLNTIQSLCTILNCDSKDIVKVTATAPKSKKRK